MAWGIVRGEDRLFRAGVARFVDALDQMRPDGSLPLETARGARALHYQRHAISSLVAIAEMAAAQGYDLYRLESENRGSLRRAIEFLLDGSRIRRWSCPTRRRTEPWPVPQLPGPGSGLHGAPWPRPALHGMDRALCREFPESAASRRLRRLLDEFGADRPLIDEFSGGNMSCFFAGVR